MAAHANTFSATTNSSASEGHARRQAVLSLIITFTIVSTGLHYAHNYIEIEHYPPSDLFSNDTIKLAILISWPVLTGVGVFGYWLYSRRLYPPAYACLILYSLLGLVTMGHFTEGPPHIGPFWYATIFTDAIGGLALLGFVVWSALSAEPAR